LLQCLALVLGIASYYTSYLFSNILCSRNYFQYFVSWPLGFVLTGLTFRSNSKFEFCAWLRGFITFIISSSGTVTIQGLYFIVVAYKLINSADVKLFAIYRLVYTILINFSFIGVVFPDIATKYNLKPFSVLITNPLKCYRLPSTKWSNLRDRAVTRGRAFSQSVINSDFFPIFFVNHTSIIKGLIYLEPFILL
jgi:hypothetical protein